MKKNVLKATLSNDLNGMNLVDGLSLQQMRFFLFYLAKINPKDMDSKLVRISLADFSKILGVELDASNIKMQCEKMLRHIVWLPMKETEEFKRGMGVFHLFKRCIIWEDHNKRYTLEIQCSEEVEEHLFNLKKNFVSFDAMVALSLNSVMAIRMYQLLKQYQKLGERTISIDSLKMKLGIEKKEYAEYKHFNNLVLKKIQKQLKEKTDIEFEYERIGRPATHIRFKISKNKAFEKKRVLDLYDVADVEIPKENEIEGVCKELFTAEATEDQYELLSESCENEFNLAQIKALVRLASSHVPFTNSSQHTLNIYDYLEKKYYKMNARGESVKDRYAYMEKMVEKDL